MMHRKTSLALCFILINLLSLKANYVDHWETVIFEDDLWKYFVGTTAPNNSWKELGFDDSSWLEGQGGFGFGDNDDLTEIPNASSIFLRKEFTIVDLSSIEKVLLNIDYDDGFVAYLNGVEFARYNIDVEEPNYDDFAINSHEAVMYNGQLPEEFLMTSLIADVNLIEGTNVLSIQVHNQFISSSDLTARAFLSFAINDESSNYSQTPSWFVEPIEFNSSNLPIVVISTEGAAIQDENRIESHMGIIRNTSGQLNFIDDPMNAYNGQITIEYRGSGSILFPKKSYRLETQTEDGENNNVAIMGMPAENDWILYGPYSDYTLLRNALVFQLGRDLGHYAPRTAFCELVLNEQYQGVYIFMEKIKRDENRVDVAVNDSEDITGGYILKIDKLTSSTQYDWSSPILPLGGSQQAINFQIHYPKPEEIEPEQVDYIKEKFTDFELNLNSPEFDFVVGGYRDYIDVESFIDFFIINELAKNVDAYRISTYFHKEKDSEGGKISMGPLWDFNLGFGGIGHCQAGNTDSWAYNFNEVCPDHDHQVPFWWSRLLEDDGFVSELHCRWDDLRLNELHTDTINSYLDSMYEELEEAQLRNMIRWPKYGNDNTYQEEINTLKNWIHQRIDWLDENMPGACISFDTPPSLFRVFPNPCESILEIRFNDSILDQREIVIFDNCGRIVEKSTSNKTAIELDISSYMQGIYLVKVVAGNQLGYQKVVKL